MERTGSNLLTEALGATGLAGRPIEYFNPVLEGEGWRHQLRLGVDFTAAFEKVLAAGTTPNGVFGAKLHFNHLRHLGLSLQGGWEQAQQRRPLNALRARQAERTELLPLAETFEYLLSLEPDLQARLEQGWTLLQSRIADLRVIWLTRENRVGRAVSHFRALSSGVWQRSVGQANAAASGAIEQFDAAEIHALYCLGCFQERCWFEFFERQGVVPLRLTYEEMVEHHQPTVGRALQWLEIGGAGIDLPAPRSLRQADAMSAEWESRYRQLGAAAGVE